MQEIHILVVEPEVKLQDALRNLLATSAYKVSVVTDGQQALALFFAKPAIDLALIETDLPGMSGFTLCAELRKRSNVPVILLSDSNRLDDMVRGFEAGADDTITKPIAAAKLSARIHALLRRMAWLREQQATSSVTVGDFCLNDDYREVRLGNTSVNLTPLEYQLLRHLMLQPERPVTKEELLHAVWAYLPAGDINFVRVVVRRLREKIEPDPAQPKYVITIPGVGYRLSAERVWSTQ